MEYIQCTITHEGKNYNVLLSGDQVNDISSDPKKYEEFVESLKANKENQGSTSNIHSECHESGSEDQAMSICETMPVKWTSEKIKLLLEVRLEMEKEFNRPSCKKSKLWQQISQKMNSTANSNFSGTDCDIKYRNLLQTYRHNKEKRLRKIGESKVTWEYFEIFDTVLGSKASSAPPREILGSTMQSQEDSSEPEERESDERTPKKLKKNGTGSKSNELSLQQYLFKKNEREMKQWEDKKELKQQEIDAMKSLADAIRFNAGTKDS